MFFFISSGCRADRVVHESASIPSLKEQTPGKQNKLLCFHMKMLWYASLICMHPSYEFVQLYVLEKIDMK